VILVPLSAPLNVPRRLTYHLTFSGEPLGKQMTKRILVQLSSAFSPCLSPLVVLQYLCGPNLALPLVQEHCIAYLSLSKMLTKHTTFSHA
jgi:hypothetical protein